MPADYSTRMNAKLAGRLSQFRVISDPFLDLGVNEEEVEYRFRNQYLTRLAYKVYESDIETIKIRNMI